MGSVCLISFSFRFRFVVVAILPFCTLDAVWFAA